MRHLCLFVTVVILTVIVCVCAFPGMCLENENTFDALIPESSDVLSWQLASKLLTLCTAHLETATAGLLRSEGFNVRGQWHYDKAFTDTGHTCAYTLASRTCGLNGKERQVALVVVRGTNGYEWQSNFDVSPSQNENTEYADNFVKAALECYYTIKPRIDLMEEPVIIVCGHSRGAAVANLLGVLFSDDMGKERVYAYTFATPNTVRGAMLEKAYTNIFNFINPCDAVPMLPPAGWGYGRAGNDIILDGDSTRQNALEQGVSALMTLAGSITDYYQLRHSLTHAGAGDDGMTAFEMLSAIVPTLAGMTTAGMSSSAFDLSAVSTESDIYPLIGMLQSLGTEDGNQLLSQHLPDAYRALIIKAAAGDAR